MSSALGAGALAGNGARRGRRPGPLQTGQVATLALHPGPSVPAWNNILCAIATFVLSLVPSRASRVQART